MTGLFSKSDADFSDCLMYRYSLRRVWDPSQPLLGWLMLNPSTADEFQDDPTIRKCIGFAHLWNCGGVWISNIFAFRSTDPAGLRMVHDPVGPRNDAAIMEMMSSCPRVIGAWGKHGNYLNRAAAVLAKVGRGRLECLKMNKDRSPQHPLYVPYINRPFPYNP